MVSAAWSSAAWSSASWSSASSLPAVPADPTTPSRGPGPDHRVSAMPAEHLPVAVVGAGFLGGPLAAALPAPVLATTRSGTWSTGPVPAGIEVRRLDVLADPPDALAQALAGARALVVCYAPGRDQDRRALYVEGTRRLLAAALATGVRRLVYTSSTSALPDRDDWLDDDCPEWPSEPRGRVQREAEALVAETCARADLPWLVLRLGGLYGPGRELFRLYRDTPGAVLPGDGMQATNLIHRDDALAAVLAALAAPPELRGVINVVDDDHTPRREIFARLAGLRDAPPPTWERSPTTSTSIGKRVRNDRMKSLLGLRLTHPRHTPGDP